MRVVKVAGSQFEISVTETELSILCGCLNEVCNRHSYLRIRDETRRDNGGRVVHARHHDRWPARI